MSAPRVLAAILNWNAGEQTSRCAEAVLRSEGVEIELLILDNASPDGSGAWLSGAFGAERVLRLDHNGGYAGGMNAALARFRDHSAADYVLLLTQDVVVAPTTAGRLVEAMRSGDRVGVVGPVITYAEEGTGGISAGGRITRSPPRAHHHREVVAEAPYDVEWIDGACMLMGRAVVEDTGLFDERYFMYFEENDFCHRARRRGWRVVVAADTRVRHGTADFPGPHYFYYMVRNSFIFWGDHYGVRFGRVALAHLADLARQGYGLAKAAASRSLWPELPARCSQLGRHGRGTLWGTQDYLRGRLGRQRF